jgi:hypothetical protein
MRTKFWRARRYKFTYKHVFMLMPSLTPPHISGLEAVREWDVAVGGREPDYLATGPPKNKTRQVVKMISEFAPLAARFRDKMPLSRQMHRHDTAILR